MDAISVWSEVHALVRTEVRYNTTLLHYFILQNFLIGAKAQYYPLSPPQSQHINSDCPNFDIHNLPIRTINSYWEFVEKLEAAKGNKTQHAAIVRAIGISGLPICAASPAFSHPFFFPLDPFHLFYENSMPHLWDTWTSSSSDSEIIYMSENIASKLGAEVESAIATLPPSFCGPIQDPHKKRQSQYKIYE